LCFSMNLSCVSTEHGRLYLETWPDRPAFLSKFRLFRRAGRAFFVAVCAGTGHAPRVNALPNML
jgi:hypothetical protein